MTKIAEAYFHLDIDLGPEDRARLKEILLRRTAVYSAGLFVPQVAFEVNVEDGSLKGWVAGLGVIYMLVSGYGSIRSGIDYVVKDAQTFSERVLSDVNQAGINKKQIIRFERRLGVPGQLQRAFRRLDHLEELGTTLGREEHEREVAEIRNALITIVRKLDNPRDVDLVLESVPERLRPPLPAPLPTEHHIRLPYVAIKPVEWDSDHETVPGPLLSQVREARPALQRDNSYSVLETSRGFRVIKKNQRNER